MTIHLNNLLLIFSDYQFFIISILFSFLGVTFISDGFRFSRTACKNIYIKYLQHIILYYMVFILIKYIFLLSFDPMKLICYLGEEGNTIDLSNKTQGTSVNSNVTFQPSLSISTEGAEKIADSIQSGASQIGLGTSIGGLAAAVGTGLSKAPISPARKAGLIVLGGIAGGTIHTGAGATALNQIRLENAMRVRKLAQESSKGSINSGKGSNSGENQESTLNETNSSNNSTNTSSTLNSSNINPKASDSSSGTNLNQSNLKTSSNTDLRSVQEIDDKQIDYLNSLDSYLISSKNKGENSWLSFDYIEKLSLDILNSNPSINYDNLNLQGLKFSKLDFIKNISGYSPSNFSLPSINYDNPMESLLQSINILAFLSLIFAILLVIDLVMLYLLRTDKVKKWKDKLSSTDNNNQTLKGSKFEAKMCDSKSPYWAGRVFWFALFRKTIIKFLDYYSKTNIFYIIITCLLLLITLSFNLYFLSQLIENFENFCRLYLEWKDK